MPRCGQSDAYQRFGAVDRRLRSPLARDESDLLLPKPVKRAILVSQPPEIWRMSYQSDSRTQASPEQIAVDIFFRA